MKPLIELTRWKEHIPFVVPLTLLGALVAVSQGGQVDWKLLWVMLANLAVVTYAFMINEIEDAEDDARDKIRKAKNPVASKRISLPRAYTAARFVAWLVILFYSLTNALTLSVGVVTLLLSHLYSWKRVRLKAYPVTDIVSHSLMLSGLLVVAGFTTYSGQFRDIWILVAAATLFSVYGQLYNQLRDYEMDVKANLYNTTILLGKKRAQMLMNVTILFSVIAVITAVYYQTFPVWLVIPGLVGAPIIFTYKSSRDMRGTASINASGSIQLQLTLLFNLVMVAWLAVILVSRLI